MPKEAFGPDHPFLKEGRLMSRDELVTIVGAFVELGVEKVRLTGGEPLLRGDLPEIIRSIKHIGVPDVSLTTNGWLLGRQAAALRAAGLDRLNISVDSLDPRTAGRMNGLGFDIGRILGGVDAAAAEGFPIKINCVVQRGVNDGEILALCAYFRERGHTLRFIEFMDVGNRNAWRPEMVVPSRELAARINERWPMHPICENYRGEVAQRWRFDDGVGEIGFISSVSQPFCGTCSRARLSSDGKFYTCLFATHGLDLRAAMRGGASDGELLQMIRSTWLNRTDRYSERREVLRRERGPAEQKIEMYYIGG